VNLERAVTPATRLGGHMVQGHVDARGKFAGVESHGDSWTLRIAYPRDIARYLVFKGSVAVEGISLTIANLTDDYFEIAIIPKTWEVTISRTSHSATLSTSRSTSSASTWKDY
jgi:riboflavin synthase